ncbi:hypothetical protein D3C80_934580 [compost metagenome]
MAWCTQQWIGSFESNYIGWQKTTFHELLDRCGGWENGGAPQQSSWSPVNQCRFTENFRETGYSGSDRTDYRGT